MYAPPPIDPVGTTWIASKTPGGKGNFQQFAVDDQDADRVLEEDWYVRVMGGKQKVITAAGVSIGRFILGVTGHTKVYHCNGNNLDARRCNLSLSKKDFVHPSEIGGTFDQIMVDNKHLMVIIDEVARAYNARLVRELNRALSDKLDAYNRAVPGLNMALEALGSDEKLQPVLAGDADVEARLVNELSRKLSEIFTERKGEFTSTAGELAF